MTLKDDMKDYRERWAEVEAVIQEERKNASPELRWRQLNAVIGLAIGLDILRTDKTEEEIYLRWAKLKEKVVNQHLQF